VIAVLRAHRKAQLQRRLAAGPEWQDHDLVIDRGGGRPWATDEGSYAFARFAEQNGFPEVRFHDLRHGFATLLLAAGVDLKVVSELMGHTTIRTTADLCASVIERVKRGRQPDSMLSLRRNEKMRM
jgi:integrase